MKKYRKKVKIELVTILPSGRVLVQNEGASSDPSHQPDRWVIDKKTFEETYEEVK